MIQREVQFGEAVERALKVNYCNFDGRASRSKYWWFCLFSVCVSVVLSIVCAILGVMGHFGSILGSIISGVVSLALLLPGLGLCVRRLHDIDKSGWWLLIACIPLVNLLLIYWYVQPSGPANQYGPVPNTTM